MESCEMMITRFDRNSDGRIDFEEFQNMLTMMEKSLLILSQQEQIILMQNIQSQVELQIHVIQFESGKNSDHFLPSMLLTTIRIERYLDDPLKVSFTSIKHPLKDYF